MTETSFCFAVILTGQRLGLFNFDADFNYVKISQTAKSLIDSWWLS